jgi:hypothetical protein
VVIDHEAQKIGMEVENFQLLCQLIQWLMA